MVWYSRPLSPDDIETQRGLPVPRFRVGEIVRTVVGNLNGSIVKTELAAPVAWYGWHWKRRMWMYKLSAQGRRRSRWYLEGQLAPV